MSYGRRNTLMLLAALALIVVPGMSYIYFAKQRPLAEERERAEEQAARILLLEQDAAKFEEVLSLSEALREQVANHPKAMFPSGQLSVMYDYLRRADPKNVFMNMSVADSTVSDTFGTAGMIVEGIANYRDLRDFLLTLEASPTLVQIDQLLIRPTANVENLEEVAFRLRVQAAYNRLAAQSELRGIKHVVSRPGFNPFLPLIRDIRPNEEERLDVERSRLIAMTSDAVFIYDQANQLQRLEILDPVYNGYLERISVDTREAIFLLDKGGIVERITLRLQQ